MKSITREQAQDRLSKKVEELEIRIASLEEAVAELISMSCAEEEE